MSPAQDEEFEKLKVARSTSKGQITAARNKLEKLLKDYVGKEICNNLLKASFHNRS